MKCWAIYTPKPYGKQICVDFSSEEEMMLEVERAWKWCVIARCID